MFPNMQPVSNIIIYHSFIETHLNKGKSKIKVKLKNIIIFQLNILLLLRTLIQLLRNF